MAEEKNTENMEIKEEPIYKERKRLLFFGLPWTFTKYTLTDDMLTIQEGLLKTEEMALLLDATEHAQLQMIEKAMKLANIFAEGEEITLTVTPDTGYLLSSLKYTNDSYEEIEIQKDENGAYKFKAPASNITILCYFEEINLYTVSIDTVDNGTVVADKTSCYPGDTVTLIKK